jgi:CRP-like cAMP-binding protein
VNPETANQACDSFWQSLTALRPVQVFSPGTKLFARGEPAPGVYLVLEGSVNLLLASDAKTKQLFEVVGPGAILALAESMTGEACRLSAVVDGPSRAFFIERDAFLQFTREHPEFCMHIVRLLSENLHRLYYRFQCSAPTGSRKYSA